MAKKHWIIAGTVLTGSFALAKAAKRQGSMRKNGSRTKTEAKIAHLAPTFYEQKIKPVMDRTLAFGGLVLLSPLYVAISLAIVIDDPGPIFFTQKRVGKDKQFFTLHKFRSMKMSTPADVPTHMLQDPEQYITRVGRVLRRTSLDELPQIWDIFRGKMSVIGPRPALWNQDDLIAARGFANTVLPGLTGLAQISGRDELEIAVKAGKDREYVSALRESSVRGFLLDCRCFFGTIKSVLTHDGVVEGGTGALPCPSNDVQPEPVKGHSGKMGFPLRTGVPAIDPPTDWGFKKTFHINTQRPVRVLITGAGSYIGESFRSYAAVHYPSIRSDTLDMRDSSWRDHDLSCYDAVLHVAGIAHADVGRASAQEIERYYSVNTDLAIETAKAAKAAGVRQFIFMSSMIIYGGAESITAETIPSPSNFYGDSKWQADRGIRSLNAPGFAVAVLRPPMIYGKGSKGNYPILAKLAKRLPFFPKVGNKRSMLYIENLAEFLCGLILSGESGVYIPQNGEYSNTSKLVALIRKTAGKNMMMSRALAPAVAVGKHVPGKVGDLVRKAFGSSWYDQKISSYDGLDYQKYSLEQSVKRTESDSADRSEGTGSSADLEGKPHILVVSQYFHPETFRINDMAVEWVKRGYKVTVLTGIPNYPMGKFFEGYGYSKRRHETWNGVEIIRIPLIPRGSSSIGMVMNYFSFVASGWWWKMMHNVHADLVFTFEVSPMTQAMIGCWYARKHHVPHYLYVTDLWPENVESVTGIHSKAVIAPIQSMVDHIYVHTDKILTCSRSFIEKIEKRGVPSGKIEFWPQYAEEFYKPMERSGDLLPQDGALNLVFAGSVGFAQGLDVLVRSAVELKKEDLPVRFNIIGDGRYLAGLQENVRAAQVEGYFNFISRRPAEEIPRYLAYADALLLTLSKSDVFAITLPAKTQSYLACGRPILVSADGEVQDVVNDAQAGLCSNAEDVLGLVSNIKRFMGMKQEERERLGSNALDYSRAHFDKEKLMDRLDKIFEFRRNGEVERDVSI
ncbi:MAG: sugar transferase [Eubacterium sp.]|nr:sugar transferase [Eubacterium sp.]MCM1342938.1 sugar transferase [Muribaculaceae bacterium]MCM1411384.1 sugar transferase [Lachnospiraceae bacterium]